MECGAWPVLVLWLFWALWGGSPAWANDGCGGRHFWRCGEPMKTTCDGGSLACQCNANNSVSMASHLSWCCLEGDCSNNSTDSCPQDPERWRCDDTCIGRDEKCKCGGEVFGRRDGKWCCDGEAQNLTQPCRGVCNDNPEDQYRDYRLLIRSYMDVCSSGEECVPEYGSCQGTAQCSDLSDLRWCKQPERIKERCQKGYRRCDTNLGLPGQCIPGEQVNDGVYHCLDRSDERPGTEIKPIDFALLKDCTTLQNYPGYTCSGIKPLPGGDKWADCHWTGYWCWPDPWDTVECENLGHRQTDNPQVCGNTNFWSQKDCLPGYSRCTGRNPGECVWGKEKCQDKSNVFGQPPCNTGEVECLRNKVRVCLHPELHCDQHPQCDAGEDEQNCLEVYKNRGFISKSATFECESPYHNRQTKTPTVKVLATRCNKEKECHLGLDESNCETKWILYTAIGSVLVTTFISHSYLFVPRYSTPLPHFDDNSEKMVPKESVWARWTLVFWSEHGRTEQFSEATDWKQC